MKENFEKEKTNDCDGQSNHKEILAVEPKSFLANISVVIIAKRKGIVFELKISFAAKISDIDIHKGEDFVIVKHAPFTWLNIVESEENIVHSLTINTVVELIQVDIIENTEVIENRRDDSSCSWDRNENFKPVDEVREELHKRSIKVIRKISDYIITIWIDRTAAIDAAAICCIGGRIGVVAGTGSIVKYACIWA